jgi:hypothetical protein
MESKSSDDMKVFYIWNISMCHVERVHAYCDSPILVGVGVSGRACGDGAVDAATKAIDRIVGYKITIEQYHLEAVTEGQEAQGRVSIVARSVEGIFNGNGTSTDIVEASAIAYMDIVNKIARMKKFTFKLPVPQRIRYNFCLCYY